MYRSSRPEVFCKKRCSWKFRKIHRKTGKITGTPFLQNTCGGCFCIYVALDWSQQENIKYIRGAPDLDVLSR